MIFYSRCVVSFQINYEDIHRETDIQSSWIICTCHMVVTEADVEEVYSWFVGLEVHGIFAMRFFFAVNVRPVWTLNGEGKCSQT